MHKILMTLMGLEIGGAETHVVELAIQLKKEGYDVAVASNGGVYVSELEENGIPHYNVPLHNKMPQNVLKAYFVLKKLIKKEKFDIVHAHARIPAYICGLLQKKLKFRFITTAHGVFRVNFLLKRLTNWGERTVAVSEDIKEYLVKNYKMPEDKIFVTINGINTEKFSKDTDASDLIKEFELDPKLRRIVHVSRMETDRSSVAFMLIDAIVKMNLPNWQAIIVGSGNDLERLQAYAIEANKKLKRRAVVVTGGRTDVNKCIALGDVFVGVSRAALEAMAESKPVIIAGSDGYIGICNSENMEMAVQTNFCARGCQESSSDLLIKDLKKVFKSDLDVMGEFGRQVILDNYSVNHMFDDYIKAYDALMSEGRNMRVLISGYYGFRNTGDDSLLKVIIESLRHVSPNFDITVLSHRPRETRRIYGVKSINRRNPISIFFRMIKGGLLINGGGSLLQDVTSTKSLVYYLTVMRMAKFCGMKVMVYANGIGPIRNTKNKRRVKSALQLVDAITLRDGVSFKELEELHIRRDKMQVTADPAFALEAVPEERVSEIFKAEGIAEDKEYFALSVRESAENCMDFVERVASICDYAYEKYGLNPLIISMQPKDKGISGRIKRMMKYNAAELNGSYNAVEILGVISRTKLVIGMRLHTLIYAATCGVPMLGLSYDPKVDAVLEVLGQDYGVAVSDLNMEILKSHIDEIMARSAEISRKLILIKEDMCEEIKKDAEIARELLCQ